MVIDVFNNKMSLLEHMPSGRRSNRNCKVDFDFRRLLQTFKKNQLVGYMHSHPVDSSFSEASLPIDYCRDNLTSTEAFLSITEKPAETLMAFIYQDKQ